MQRIKTIFIAAAGLLCLLVVSTNTFAQTGAGSIAGDVEDASGAKIPGVTVTVTSTETGVSATTLSNEAGQFSFISLIPRKGYRLTADLPGFQTASVKDIELPTNVTLRFTLKMQVAAAGQRVEVSVSAQDLLNTSSSSVGEVLPEQRIRDLPVVNLNVLDLLAVLPGFRESQNGAAQDTVGGLSLNTVNATINGISTVSSRDGANFWGYQTLTTTVVNPDLVGEIRLILAPVDAELGRGNAQVQITTRSGTNKYNGSAVWNFQNSALNSNTWDRNRNTITVDGQTVWSPTRPDWSNIHTATISYGGPIIKNKTFFYALYNQNSNASRVLVNNQVLTDTARNGIFRYWSGWNNGNAIATVPSTFTGSTTAVYPSVNFNGDPVAPLRNNSDGSPYTGQLVCLSVFGSVKMDGTPFTSADCRGGSGATAWSGVAVTKTGGGAWDTYRSAPDPTGYIQRMLALAPHANFYANQGDGLNTATNRYVRGRSGSNSDNGAIGVNTSGTGAADQPNRKQFNLKVDENINSKHRLSVQWQWELDTGVNSQAPWDGGLSGSLRRKPQFLAINGTSTLTPTLVNESRFGVNYSTEYFLAAVENANNPEVAKEAQSFLINGGVNPENGKVFPIRYDPGTNLNGFVTISGGGYANTSPLWNYADTLSWTRGKHAFKFGGEYRRPLTTGYNNSALPSASTGTLGGIPAIAAVFTTPNTSFPELTGLPAQAGGNRANITTLLNQLTGSISAASTAYWIDNYEDIRTGHWRNTTNVVDEIPTAFADYGHQSRKQVSNEWSFFVKDDYKITKRLTLNLGVRGDFFGSPYLGNGLTSAVIGRGPGLYGAGRSTTGNYLDNWLTPGNMFLSGYGSNPAAAGLTPLTCSNTAPIQAGLPAYAKPNCDPALMSIAQFIGPESPNPDDTLVPQSWQISPAIGFAWQVPFFGDGKTTIRGGFQRTAGGAGQVYSGGLLGGPANDSLTVGLNVADPYITSVIASGRALNISDLPKLVPNAPTRLPGQTFPFTGRNINITYSEFDPDYVTSYTDNFTLSLTTNLRRNMSLDVRFVDTLGRKQPGTAGALGSPGSFNLNTVNVFHNPELFNALEVTRAGGDDPLFDQILQGLNLNSGAGTPGYGLVGSCVATGQAGPGLGGCPVNQARISGSSQVRRLTAANLANGNYSGVVTTLLGTVLSGTASATVGNQGLPIDPVSGVTAVSQNRVFRNGCDRLANGFANATLADGTTAPQRCFPENYLIANPQMGTASLAKNLGHTNYSSLQVQYTLRPTQGTSVQATYGFSKTMQQPGSGFTDPLRPELDYGTSTSSIGHDFRANGTIELPIGPNKLLLGNSSGWVARVLEKWQTSFIFNLPSGTIGRTISSSSTTLYANGRPDVVGPFGRPEGQIKWDGENNASGSYFGTPSPYVSFVDPQCYGDRVNSSAFEKRLATPFEMQAQCTLRGLAQIVPAGTPGAFALNDAQGRYALPLLQNPLPGKQGTLGKNILPLYSRWRLDANVSKTFQIRESMSLQLRIDGNNILNHPFEDDYTITMSDGFGQIGGKGTQVRTFQGQVRLTF